MDGQCCLHRNGSVEKDDGFIDVIEQNWMNVVETEDGLTLFDNRYE